MTRYQVNMAPPESCCCHMCGEEWYGQAESEDEAKAKALAELVGEVAYVIDLDEQDRISASLRRERLKRETEAAEEYVRKHGAPEPHPGTQFGTVVDD